MIYSLAFFLLLLPMSAPTLRFLSLFHHIITPAFLAKTFCHKYQHLQSQISPSHRKLFSQAPLSFSFHVIVFFADLISSLTTVFLFSFSEVIFCLLLKMIFVLNPSCFEREHAFRYPDRNWSSLI